jgi:hypothetical protein
LLFRSSFHNYVVSVLFVISTLSYETRSLSEEFGLCVVLWRFVPPL